MTKNSSPKCGHGLENVIQTILVYNSNERKMNLANNRPYLYIFGISFLISALLIAAAVFMYRGFFTPTPLSSWANSGGMRQTSVKSIVRQANRPIGDLQKGTRLWYESQPDAENRMRLFLEWKNDGTFEDVFLPVNDNGTEILCNLKPEKK